MKKSLFFVAAIALFAACSQNSEIQTISSEDNAISFNAYTNTAITRGTIKTGDELNNIGVFAFYQPNGVDFNTHKFSTPDFMYNQKVTKGTDKWTYTPVKYWPNNENDKLSFFAYSPYESGKQWADLGIATDQNNTKMTVSFPIYNEVPAQKDYLWAHPALNKSNAAQLTTGGYKVNDSIAFTFKHITSRFQLFVGVQQNVAKGNTTAPDATNATAWTDQYTTITINSIEFKGVGETLTYKYNLAAAIDDVSNPDVSASGSQDIVLTKEDNFQAGYIDNNWQTGWHTLLKQEYDSITGTKQLEEGYLFLAPQDNIGSNKVIITYTVKTTAYKEGSTTEKDEANSSEITNTIEKTWSNFAASISKFEAGHAYKLYFLIGMNQVNITASETAWVVEGDHQVDVPANK